MNEPELLRASVSALCSGSTGHRANRSAVLRRSILLVLASFFVIWAVEAFWLSPSPPGDLLWVMRQEGMLLTGILALGAMTAIMVLALRPRWVESPLGGMDKAYRLHKWLGIIAITLSLAHWLAKQS